MNEVKRDALKPEEELVDVLLDFIIVSATLAKKVTLAVRKANQGRSVQRCQK